MCLHWIKKQYLVIEIIVRKQFIFFENLVWKETLSNFERLVNVTPRLISAVGKGREGGRGRRRDTSKTGTEKEERKGENTFFFVLWENLGQKERRVGR